MNILNGCPVVQAYTLHLIAVSYLKIDELCSVTQKPAVDSLDEPNCSGSDKACSSNCWMKEPRESE